jgi:hypothetical protein
MRRLRFSVFDLFVVTLGVAGGLAYHRLPGVGWSDALLVMCAAWIVVGMVQQARSAAALWRSFPSADRELRNGAALALARPIAVIAMLTAAVGFEAVERIGPGFPFRAAIDEFMASRGFTAALFSLAIICAYTAPGRAEARNPIRRKTVFQCAVGVLALLLSCILLLYVLVSAQFISGLVHIAIRGVEMAQPTRWNGKPFHPYDPQVQLLAEFFWRAIMSASAVAISAICTALLTVAWNQRSSRRLLIAMSTMGVLVAAYLVHWYWTVGFPTVSPLVAANTGQLPWYVVAAGIAVFAAACFLFAMRYVPEPRSSDHSLSELPRPYHLSGAVMSLLLLAMILGALPASWLFDFVSSLWSSMDLLDHLQNWWEGGASLSGLSLLFFQMGFGLLSHWVEEPKMLLRLAAVLVVFNQLRRWRRGEVFIETLAPVRVAKLFTITGLAAVSLLLAIPAGAWLGFAIVTTPIGGL